MFMPKIWLSILADIFGTSDVERPSPWIGWIGLTLWWTCISLRNMRGDFTAKWDFCIHSACLVFALPSHATTASRYAQAVFIACMTYVLGFYIPSIPPKASDALQRNSNASSGPPKAFLMKPIIFPCRITHSRIFPRKHSFSYSYLLVGIPVGWCGRAGSLLSAGSSTKRGWLHVDASEHLDRHESNISLADKLNTYLKSQGINETEFPYIYLITAPQVLGYSFSPVSFWYLYSANQELRAMVLEVNNTFDERRMYFLRRSVAEDESKHASPNAKLVHEESGHIETEDDALKLNFSTMWAKDFHVSPFNSRKGSYRLQAQDPQPFRGCKSISNTITLLSSQSHPKLVARVFSTSNSIDPDSLPLLLSLRFLISWAWTGFFTFPRIVREAWKLFFEKKLRVWYRPEVKQGSIGRRSTAIEKNLERFFFRYLKHAIEFAERPVRLTYTPPADIGPQLEINSLLRSQNPEHVELRVLSPAFYSRFVHYAHTTEAFDREFLCSDLRNQTVMVSKLGLLLSLFLSIDYKARGAFEESRFGIIEWLRWTILQTLRCPPTAQSYPCAVHEKTVRVEQDIRSKPLSQLDLFIIVRCADNASYRRSACLLFYSERFAFGFTGIVSGLELILRSCLIFFAIRYGSRQKLLQWTLHIWIPCILHIWAYLKGLNASKSFER